MTRGRRREGESTSPGKGSRLTSFILAAGPGTRLRPLSYYIPKVLLPVAGRPVFEHLVEGISRVKPQKHYVIASEFVESIKHYLQATANTRTDVVRALGWETGGDLALALEQIQPSGDVIVANGDIVTDLAVDELLQFHRARRGLATVAAIEISNPDERSRFGTIRIDERGRVLGFTEKPSRSGGESQLVNAGLYVFDRRLVRTRRLDYLSPHRFKLEVELFPRLAREGELYAYRSRPSYWWDVGTMASYLAAERSLSSPDRASSR